MSDYENLTNGVPDNRSIMVNAKRACSSSCFFFSQLKSLTVFFKKSETLNIREVNVNSQNAVTMSMTTQMFVGHDLVSSALCSGNIFYVFSSTSEICPFLIYPVGHVMRL